MLNMLSDIIAAFKDASPWVVLGLVILGIAYLYFDYRKTKLEHRRALAAQSEFAQVLAAVDGFKTQLRDHTTEDQRMIQGLHATNMSIAQGMKQIVGQLISLNAATAGKTMSPSNSRTVIQYQWNWCRDETIKILMTSIERNHIEGREQAVAIQVFRAWKRAAGETKASIERVEGLAYDPHMLLNSTTLNKIWNMVWAKALPIYFKDFPIGSGSIDDHKTELIESIKNLFDQAFEEFVACLYEADHGTTSRTDRSDSNIAVNSEDLDAVAQMVKDMRGYRPGSGAHHAAIKKSANGDDEDTDKLAVRRAVADAAKSDKQPKRDS